MADFRIYIAGRINGPKWQIPVFVERFITDIYAMYPPKHPTRFAFISSDANEHDMFGCGSGYGESKNDVEERVLSLITQADCLVAYLDDHRCYGTIAELAYASAIGKPSLLFISDKDDDRELLIDAYRLVSNFPHVTTFEVPSPLEAAFVTWSVLQCESPIETQLLSALLCKGIDVIPQLWIGDYRVDFAIIPSKLVIEVDGHDFHSSKDQRARDAKRDRFLQSEGWRVIRFTGSEIYADPYAAASEVLSMVATNTPLEKDVHL